jgi:2C-methyl-D-erythritol 2,4-cyclodiphosphate synthase
MKKSSKKLFIVIIVGAVLLCSGVIIFSQPDIVHLEQKLIPPGEYVPTGPELLPQITSHEEAIAITDAFLRENLGTEFFETHLKVKGIDEMPYIPSTWIVLYEYTYNEYTVEFMIVIDIRRVPPGTSRIDENVSNSILEPQEILISEEEAKRIAQEYGLEPPYNVILSCEVEYHRICWRIVRKDLENLTEYDLAGMIIDAGSGTILDASTKCYGDRG